MNMSAGMADGQYLPMKRTDQDDVSQIKTPVVIPASYK